jgi:threonylcarbamoyladenosine tRNA methylthiotransferase MtaB
LKRVAFCTFGCRLNQYDTEVLRTLFEGDGEWRTVSFEEEADVYVVNTCTVTAKADARARTLLRRLGQERPGARIVAAGCWAQRAPAEVAAIPGVSLVLGAAERVRVREELEAAEAGRVRVAVGPISEARSFPEIPVTELMERSRAFVKVQEGCNESCTFCVIPQTRGASRSRRPEHVVAQVRHLVRAGYGEIVLTGVHVGDYGLDLEERRRLLPGLIRDVLRVEDLARFRLSSIEPSTVTPELVDLLAGEEKFARHLHLPLQSGSPAILSRMNRRYTVGEFVDLLERIVARVPDCGLGTDVICGFPGETDERFRETFDRLEQLPITYLHAFTYSERPGSAALALDGAVPGDVRKRRTSALRRLSAEKSLAFRRSQVGREAQVFVEGMRKADTEWLSGLTGNYIRADLGPGRAERPLVRARLTAVTDDGMVGERIDA